FTRLAPDQHIPWASPDSTSARIIASALGPRPSKRRDPVGEGRGQDLARRLPGRASELRGPAIEKPPEVGGEDVQAPQRARLPCPVPLVALEPLQHVELRGPLF